MKNLKNTTFYFIRHGQTDANQNKQVCGGDWDIALNNEGREQAKQALLTNIDLLNTLDKVFVSPMQRASETATILTKNLNVELISVENLREWCVGEWETKKWDEVPNPFNTEEDPPNGETRLKFEQRVIESIHSILLNTEGETPLFVSHGAVAHILFSYLGIDVPYIKNATLYKIESLVSSWSLTEL